jgi:hypothetical protein
MDLRIMVEEFRHVGQRGFVDQVLSESRKVDKIASSDVASGVIRTTVFAQSPLQY